MSPQEQLEEIKKDARVIRNAQVREVENGFIINTSISYADKASGGVLATVNNEAIAADAASAADAVARFLA